MFEQMKDMHKGVTGVCIGTGPTIGEFKPKDEWLLFGCNEAIYLPYKMDYYFIGDVGSKKRGYLTDPETYDKYEPRIAKFYRKPGAGGTKGMPEGCENAIYYDAPYRANKGGIREDLTSGFSVWANISMEIMQFMLYTGCNPIYVAGHDCNYAEGSFHDKGECVKQDAQYALKAWDKIKGFSEEHYPDTEIYSIRPVGLKLFKEIET
jgi:hypothetical protein